MGDLINGCYLKVQAAIGPFDQGLNQMAIARGMKRQNFVKYIQSHI